MLAIILAKLFHRPKLAKPILPAVKTPTKSPVKPPKTPEALSPPAVKQLQPLSQPPKPPSSSTFTPPVTVTVPSNAPAGPNTVTSTSSSEYDSDDTEANDEVSLSALPLDADGLPSMVRVMSFRSLDHLEATESDTDEDDADGDFEDVTEKLDTMEATASLMDKLEAKKEDSSSDEEGSGEEEQDEDESETSTSRKSSSSAFDRLDNGGSAPVLKGKGSPAKSTCSSLSSYSTMSIVDNTVLDGVQVGLILMDFC